MDRVRLIDVIEGRKTEQQYNAYKIYSANLQRKRLISAKKFASKKFVFDIN